VTWDGPCSAVLGTRAIEEYPASELRMPLEPCRRVYSTLRRRCQADNGGFGGYGSTDRAVLPRARATAGMARRTPVRLVLVRIFARSGEKPDTHLVDRAVANRQLCECEPARTSYARCRAGSRGRVAMISATSARAGTSWRP
jgi:hypothetical protein